jgi:hypothetical protein
MELLPTFFADCFVLASSSGLFLNLESFSALFRDRLAASISFWLKQDEELLLERFMICDELFKAQSFWPHDYRFFRF